MRQLIARLEIRPCYRDWAVVALLGALLVAFFWKVFFLGRALIPADLLTHFTPWSYYPEYSQSIQNPLLSDPVRLYYPWRFYFAETMKKRVIPLWNPYVFSGVPFLANTQTAVFYPLNLLFLLLPLPAAYSYQTILHLFLAGLSMYGYLRCIHSSRFGALVAAIAFMFSGFFIAWLEFPSFLSTTIWLPFILLAMHKALEGHSVAYAIVAGLAIGTQFLGGHIQASYFVLIATSAYAGFRFLYSLPERRERGRLVRFWALVMLIFGLGFAVASVQLLPTWEISGLIIRSQEHYSEIAATALPSQNLITFLIPDFFGNPADSPFWGAGNYTEYAGYIGIAPLVLAFVSLALRRDKYTLFFSLVLSGSLLLALGTPLYRLFFDYLPVFRKLRGAGRFLYLCDFSIAVLAGLGSDYMVRVLARDKARIKGAILSLLAFVAVVAAVAFFSLWKTIYGLHLAPPGMDPSHPSLSFLARYLWARGGFFSLLVITGVIALIPLFLAKRLKSLHFQIAVGVLLVIDLFHFGMKYNPATDPRLAFFETNSTEFLASDSDYYRIIRFGSAPLFSPLTPNTGMVFRVADSDGSDSFVLKRYVEFLNLIEDHGDFARRYNSQGNLLDASSLASPLLDFLNVKYVLTSDSLADTQVHREGQDVSDGTIPVTGEAQPGQSFVASYDGLNRVDVIFAKQEAINEGEVIFHLKTDPASPEHVAFIPVSISQLEDRTYHTFYFAPIPDSKDQRFYFYLESPGSTVENAILLMASSKDRYPQGTAYLNGQPLSGDLRFAYYSAPLYEAEDLGLELVFNEDIHIYENVDVMPRAFVVHRVEVIKDDSELLKRLKSETFDPRHSLLIGEELSPLELAMNEEAPLVDGSEARVTNYQPNTVTVEARMESDGFLVLSDVYYPGWKAYVDREERKMYRANYTFRAVYLDEGHHVIQLSYQPASFRLGSIVSLISLLSAVAILGYAAYSRIHHRGE